MWILAAYTKWFSHSIQALVTFSCWSAVKQLTFTTAWFVCSAYDIEHCQFAISSKYLRRNMSSVWRMVRLVRAEQGQQHRYMIITIPLSSHCLRPIRPSPPPTIPFQISNASSTSSDCRLSILFKFAFDQMKKVLFLCQCIRHSSKAYWLRWTCNVYRPPALYCYS